ncbi:MAG: EscN/YscN/HrcN family type III secretion system ATPase, partial [Clostridiales bacterium]|nr:EscN/YscN/HrcN family type III secretion system ATPase [Clostridiales bacterium]
MKHFDIDKYRRVIKETDPILSGGKVSQVIGLTVEAVGLTANIGDICKIYTKGYEEYVLSEVVGFRDKCILLMPFGDLSGIGSENYVVTTNRKLKVSVGHQLLGRVLDALGNPMDGKGAIEVEDYYPISSPPPNPLERSRIKETLPLGIKAIDSLLTIGKGQRVGVFAGSGVGKSTLLGMIARNTDA